MANGARCSSRGWAYRRRRTHRLSRFHLSSLQVVGLGASKVAVTHPWTDLLLLNFAVAAPGEYRVEFHQEVHELEVRARVTEVAQARLLYAVRHQDWIVGTIALLICFDICRSTAIGVAKRSKGGTARACHKHFSRLD